MTTDPKQVKGYQLLNDVGAKALTDTDYRRRLLDDPKTVLRDEGLVVADDIEVVVLRNRPNLIYLALPSQPAAKDALDADEVDLVPLIRHHPF